MAWEIVDCINLAAARRHCSHVVSVHGDLGGSIKYGKSMTIAVHLSAAEEVRTLLQDAVRPTGTVCGTLGHAEEVNFMVLQYLMGEFIQP